ncbi:hypothetical protein GOODEAATRI_028308 [Goodea atripinnis]|uniref:Secreted protein n=1 Tax=Goodea atripinnis TaxID=208336 RepID=A0ABV0MVW7_9TELE
MQLTHTMLMVHTCCHGYLLCSMRSLTTILSVKKHKGTVFSITIFCAKLNSHLCVTHSTTPSSLFVGISSFLSGWGKWEQYTNDIYKNRGSAAGGACVYVCCFFYQTL